MTLAAFPGQTINPATAGAQAALLEDCFGFLNPPLQLTGMIKPLISRYLAYSSSSSLFFFFFIISTVGGGGRIVIADIFLVSFFVFFGSLCL